MVLGRGKAWWAIALGLGVWMPCDSAVGEQAPAYQGRGRGIVQSMKLSDPMGDRRCELTLLGDAGYPFDVTTDINVCRRNVVGYRVNVIDENGQGTAQLSKIEVLEPPRQGVIQAMSAGDRACYVTIVDDMGQKSTEFASFELCEQDFNGQKLNFSYRLAPILAARCNGDVDCGKSDWVMLIERATVTIPGLQEALLPNLTPADLTNLKTALVNAKDTWFSLAGLDKAPQPPAFPPSLNQYRQTWQQKNPAIAPFLGQWHNDEGYPYSLSIFPTTETGKVCILEFRPEWSLDILNEETGEINKDMIAEQILSFSVAKVENGILRSSRIRTSNQAIAPYIFSSNQAETVELMSVFNTTDYPATVAAADLPKLPPDFPDILAQSITPLLQANHCII
jgi:hypothetical protein